MRRIALINQKGGVGKTTTTANLGAALALGGRRVVLIDLDPQGNLSLHLDVQVDSDAPSTYSVLLGNGSFREALRDTSTRGLRIVPANIDLSGAELELASALGREALLRDALDQWEQEERAKGGSAPADYVLIDCPPSLGLLSVNGLVAAREAIITLQTEFFALQGMSKLMEVLTLLRKRLNPGLTLAGILPCMYDSRLKLAREVLAEIRQYFPGKVFERSIGKNVKLAEAPSYGKTIFEYAPESSGALDYTAVARELMRSEPEEPGFAPLQGPATDASITNVAARRAEQAPKTRPRTESSRAPALQPASPPESVLPPLVLTPVRPPTPSGAAPPAALDPRAHLSDGQARSLAVAADRPWTDIAAPVPPAVETVHETRGGVVTATLADEPDAPAGAEIGELRGAPEGDEELPPLPDDAILLSDEPA